MKTLKIKRLKAFYCVVVIDCNCAQTIAVWQSPIHVCTIFFYSPDIEKTFGTSAFTPKISKQWSLSIQFISKAFLDWLLIVISIDNHIDKYQRINITINYPSENLALTPERKYDPPLLMQWLSENYWGIRKWGEFLKSP